MLGCTVEFFWLSGGCRLRQDDQLLQDTVRSALHQREPRLRVHRDEPRRRDTPYRRTGELLFIYVLLCFRIFLHQIEPSAWVCRMSERTQDGTAEPTPRETKFSGADGDREKLEEKKMFPIQLTTSTISNLTRLMPSLLIAISIHTFMHMGAIPDSMLLLIGARY